MGNSTSTSTSTPPEPVASTTTIDSTNPDPGKQTQRRKKPRNKKFKTLEEEAAYLAKLTTPERAFYHCRKENKAFKKCYSQWWGVAVKGAQLEVDRSECDELMTVYQDCVLAKIAQEREVAGLPSAHPESLVGTFEQDKEDEE
mmetsp:Transcript_19746/g.29368  ORF Transcript_19746/g.29368 Transcript_19746/m.29368 type:complete len:143 (+) Transcript_19746:27-455(+)